MTEIAKKNRIKKRIIFDTIAVIFIAMTPFLYKIYDYLPVDPEATISFLGITIDNHGFADVSTYIWFLTVKFIPFFIVDHLVFYIKGLVVSYFVDSYSHVCLPIIRGLFL